MKPKKYHQPKYEYPIDEINWTAGVGQPAGLFWLDGRVVMAAHESEAESALLARGAIIVATLRFDADPLEAVHRTGTVERLPAREAADTFMLSATN